MVNFDLVVWTGSAVHTVQWHFNELSLDLGVGMLSRGKRAPYQRLFGGKACSVRTCQSVCVSIWGFCEANTVEFGSLSAVGWGRDRRVTCLVRN